MHGTPFKSLKDKLSLVFDNKKFSDSTQLNAGYRNSIASLVFKNLIQSNLFKYKILVNRLWFIHTSIGGYVVLDINFAKSDEENKQTIDKIRFIKNKMLSVFNDPESENRDNLISKKFTKPKAIFEQLEEDLRLNPNSYVLK